MSAYRRHTPFSARLEFPTGERGPLELRDLLQVAVGNGRHYGGGNAVSPTAGIDDHILDVYAIERGRLRDHVSIARLFTDGSFVEHERVHHLTTRCVRLVTEPLLPVNLDGELAAKDAEPLRDTTERGQRGRAPYGDERRAGRTAGRLTRTRHRRPRDGRGECGSLGRVDFAVPVEPAVDDQHREARET